MMIGARTAAWAKAGEDYPDSLSYLTNLGSPYHFIKTGILPSLDLEIFCRVCFTADRSIIGSFGTSHLFVCQYSSGSLRIRGPNAILTEQKGNWHDVYFSSGLQTVDGVEIGTSQALQSEIDIASESNRDIWIGGYHRIDDSINDAFYGNVGRIWIKKAGVKLWDSIAFSDENGTGMIDRVSGVKHYLGWQYHEPNL